MEADLNPGALVDMDNATQYDSQDALRVLMDSIGIEMRERDRIVTDGFTSVDEIVTHFTNNVDGFAKYLAHLNKSFASSNNPALQVYFSPMAIQRLIGVVHYFNVSVNLFHTIPELTLVDAESASAYYRHYKLFSAELEEDDTKVPELQGAHTWVDFRDKFMMKLSKVKGVRGTSLAYVIDQTTRHSTSETEDYDEVAIMDITDPESYTTLTMHFGEGYVDDNKAVWNILKALLLGKSGYNHISKFHRNENGREAWITLQTYYEGPDFIERTREEAFTKLSHTFYKGETSRFNFNKYVDVHKLAHKMLDDCKYNNGQGMDEATKIQHLKSGIKQDAGLEVALTQLRGNSTYNTFDQVISFLTAEVEHRSIRRKQLKAAGERRVSSATGRGNGRRGQGNSNNNSIKSKSVDGKVIYAKRYSKQEFNSLTRAQRDAVIQLNREQRKNKSSKGKNKNTKFNKSIKALESDMISISEAIISGVQRATGEDISITADQQSSDQASNSPDKKRKATSGSVGEFLKKRRQGGSS